MSTTFQRAPVTAYLLEYLETETDFKCGDGVIPTGAGWGTTQPNKPAGLPTLFGAAGGQFVPYTVLTTMTASPAPGTGSIGTPQEDWHLPYVIQSFGVARLQAETMADKVRAVMTALIHTIIDCHTNDVVAPNNFKVQDVWQQSVGGINRTPGSDPAFFGQQDQFVIWLAKRRT